MSLWQRSAEQFSALQQREKVIIYATSVLVVVWLLMMQWILPAIELLTKENTNLNRLQQDLTAQQQLLSTLQQSEALDPNQAYNTRIAQLQAQEQQLQQQVAALASYFISSDKMASMLHDVLLSSEQVQLKSLKALPAVPLTFADKASDEKATIYQHPTLVVLSGDYFALTNMLHKLDKLPWSVSWQSIDYQVKNFPKAELTLSLLTVSDHESYIKL